MIVGRDFGRLLQAVRQRRLVQFAQHADRSRVVRVEDCDRIGMQVFENSPLGLAIVFDRAVPVEVVAGRLA